VDEMGEACSAHGEMRNAYQILVREPEGKISVGRYRSGLRRSNIKMDLRKMDLKGVDWIHLD
jgi:hypothetical protein